MIHAQGDCRQMLKDAHAARDADNFITAIHRYNAVRKCDPNLERLANEEVLKIFEKLKKLKEEAVLARAKAEKAQIDAEEKATEARRANEQAEQAKRQTERSERVARNAVTAMKAARTNPVIGLRMAQYLRDAYPDLSISSAVFNDIFLRNNQFYQKHLRPFQEGDYAVSL
ncbi:MAG TPA: hypothetical protein PK858_01670, partial [Saprospiraceae bacterium]|nr:hypothetical protein [Saprospiraceae bacterium]